MEEFYVRKEPLTDWLQQKICVLLQCKYCWYVWGIWGQQRGSELALLLCHHFVFWTGKIILLSIFSPIFLSKLQEFKACNKEREKLWIYVSNMAVWEKKSASIHLFLCLRKFTKQHICKPTLSFLFFKSDLCFQETFLVWHVFAVQKLWKEIGVKKKKSANHRLQNGTAWRKWSCLYFDFRTCMLVQNCHLLERAQFSEVRTWGRQFLLSFFLLGTQLSSWGLLLSFLIIEE